MAEGFARAYGADLVSAQSAGLAPAAVVASLTHKVMLEKNIKLGDLSPRSIDQVMGGVDLIVNISGHELPFKTKAPVEDWQVRDPIGESEKVYRQVRDEIEERVKKLISSLRAKKPPASAERPGAQRVDSQGRGPRK